VLCRTGGEEFLILLPGAPLEIASTVAQRLRTCVQDSAIAPVGAVTVSLGVAQWQASGAEQPATTLSKADRALYAAKRAGRNQVSVSQAGD